MAYVQAHQFTDDSQPLLNMFQAVLLNGVCVTAASVTLHSMGFGIGAAIAIGSFVGASVTIALLSAVVILLPILLRPRAERAARAARQAAMLADWDHDLAEENDAACRRHVA